MRSQLTPPLVERKKPPRPCAASAMAYTTSGSAGEIASPMRPRSPAGNPACAFTHGLPPSADRCTPDPGPPATKQHVRRWRCHVVATRTSGLRGSICTSLAPVQSSTWSIRVHVVPPSVVLYMPRSPPLLHTGPCDATYTTSEFRGSIRIRPICSLSLRPTFFHDRPPSIDL